MAQKSFSLKHFTSDFVPRDFQPDIVSSTALGNTLLVVDTGLGKTATALMAADSHLATGKVLFLAHTQALVDQHALSIAQFMKVPGVTTLTGQTAPLKRSKQWRASPLCICTPETFINDAKLGYVSLADFSLLIVDEVDLASKEYAYVHIGKELHGHGRHPAVFCMTASPGKQAHFQQLLELFRIVNIQIVMPDDPRIKKYTTEKVRKFLWAVLDEDWLARSDELREMMDDCWQRFADHGVAGIPHQKATEDNLREIAALSFRLTEGSKKHWMLASSYKEFRKLQMLYKLFERYSYHSVTDYFAKQLAEWEENKVQASRRIYFDSRMKRLREYCYDTISDKREHPKMHLLNEALAVERSRERVILFCDWVGVARRLAWWIQKHLDTPIGQFYGQKHMRGKERRTELERFKNKETRILICSSAAERGIDLPVADCVMNYDAKASALSTIQREGRLRKDGDLVYIMSLFWQREGYPREQSTDQINFMRAMSGITKMRASVRERAQQTQFQLPLLY